MDINTNQLLLRKLLFDQCKSPELKAKMAVLWFEHDAQALINKLIEEDEQIGEKIYFDGNNKG